MKQAFDNQFRGRATRRMARCVLLLACISLAAALVTRPTPKRAVAVSEDGITSPQMLQRIAHDDEILNRHIGELVVNAMSLDKALDSLAKLAKVEIRVDWKALAAVGVGRNGRIHVNMRNATLGQALRAIVNDATGGSAFVEFEVDGDFIRLSSAVQLGRITELYNIRPLIEMMCAKSAWHSSQLTYQEAVDTIGAIIDENIDPPWGGDGGSDVREMDGLLIIQQSRRAHREILRILLQLDRELRATAGA